MLLDESKEAKRHSRTPRDLTPHFFHTPSSPPWSPAEEVLLDENEEAKRHKFYMVGGFEESPDHT